mmetsp:Transcript_63468/g.112861  ORF Transcript_63468/g.112861 Transcript_63468/m.112861 type:complete len:645 (-) Transcript_63468:88-2022(-)
MAAIDEAVKAAFREEFQEYIKKITEQEERCAKLEQSLEEMSGRVEERGREVQGVRDDMEKQKSDMEALDTRTKSDLEEMSNALKERLDRHENDEEGEGGLAQLRAKVDGFAEEIAKMQARMEENGKTVSTSKSRTDVFEESVKQLSRTCEEVTTAVETNQARLKKVEETSSLVRERQQVVEDSVARKYDILWQDVLKAMAELKASQEKALYEDLQRRTSENRREGQSHIKYVTQLVASVHDERRKLAISKDLMTVWRQHTWDAARRRTGMNWLANTLNGIAMKRQRKLMNRWVRQTSIEDLAKRLREEYAQQIPDVQQAIKDSKIPDRCDQLDQRLNELRGENCSVVQVEEKFQELQDLLRKKMDLVEEVRSQVNGHGQILLDVRADYDAKHGSHAEHAEEVKKRLGALDEHVVNIFEAHHGFAPGKDVQTMMRDTLLIWNSIKQLDAAKADKKEMDSFAVETSNRDRNSNRKLEDLQSLVAQKLHEETQAVQEKCSELDLKVDESAKQFRHWEQMWERLAGFVEDLVVKVGDLQGGSHNRLHATPLRGGSRPPSARTRFGKAGTPTGDEPTDRSLFDTVDPSAAETTAESRMIHVGSAKVIVESSLDHAVTKQKLGGPGPRVTRPLSASNRRAIDRRAEFRGD